MLIRSRRDFLKTTFGVAAGMGALAKFGEMAAVAANPSNSQPYQALVCIYLAGGNDCHNTVFPIATAKNSYNLYHQGRQTLALPSLGVPTINDGSDVYGLHPKLVE